MAVVFALDLACCCQPDRAFAGKVVIQVLVNRSEVAGLSLPVVVISGQENLVSKAQDLAPATLEVFRGGGVRQAVGSHRVVAVHVPEEDLPGRLELWSDEAQPEHPASEGVFLVFGLLGLWARVFQFLCQLAHCEAKLDVSLHLTRVNPALASVVRVAELEKPELNGALRECRVKIEHMVAAVVVMLAPAVVCAVAFVPAILELLQGFRFLLVDTAQESVSRWAGHRRGSPARAKS